MKNLKTTIIIMLGVMVSVVALNAQNITTPRTPSPAAKVKQTIGISEVTVNYSRPAVNDREIWGKLVKYGWNVEGFGAGNESPWRAGANENTTITFSHNAKVEGKDVPAGTYGLFFVINEDNSGEVILSKDHRSWGQFWYDAANDMMRAPIQIRDHAMTERLTYDFGNLDKTTGELVLNWEKKQFPVKISFDVDAIVVANAEEELKGTTGFSWRGYSSAANYCLLNDVALDKGIVWIDQAIAGARNFTNLQIKSGLVAKQGNKEESDKLMAEAMKVATEPELNVYGYQLLNQQDYDKAIEVLAMNTERFPESANCWDSLGEAYAIKGDKKNAIKNFKKSLSLDPPANVKANSEKYLKELGAM